MSASDESAIRALIAAREAAVADANAEGTLAALAPDAVVYDLQPPLEYAGEAARDPSGLEQWFKTWRAPPQVRLHDPRILIDGDLAVAHGLSRMRGTKVKDGELDQWSRTTLVFRRDADGWKIVHEHNSMPMKMDGSNLVALDLKPK